MRKPILIGKLSFLLVFSLLASGALAEVVTYEITAKLTLNIGTVDSLLMEGADYKLVLEVDTDVSPGTTAYNADVPYVYARFKPSSSQATITVKNRPSGAEDLVFYRTIGEFATRNQFNWDGTPAESDQLWITLATVAPPDGFFQLHSGSEVYIFLRQDYWSNDLNDPPDYFPDVGQPPKYFLPTDILGDPDGSAFQGRIAPIDPFASYGYRDFAIKTSAKYGRFVDVPTSHWAFNYIEWLALSGLTAGCSTAAYCPDDEVTRGQMAVFLERGMRGSSFVPPTATGNVFLDVPSGAFAANFIEQLYADGITAGCGAQNYCPRTNVSRAQMAVFLLRAKYGASYLPPAPTGIFEDVDTAYWAAGWIEQLDREGITSGCGSGNYCPGAPVTRAQMAVFLVRTFGL